MYRKVGAILLVTFGLIQLGWTQVTNSPLTQQGIGDLYQNYQPNNFGMGGLGISHGDLRYINNQNPALLVYNSIYTYSAGTIGETRQTTDDANSQKAGSMNLSHLGMSFPIKANKWVSSIILSPYSHVEYQFVNSGTVGEATYEYTKKGSQGLVQLEWAHGIRLTDNLKIGAKAKYLFGSIKRESGNVLTSSGVNTSNVPTISDRDAVSDFLFGLGAQYRHELSEGSFLNVGLTYDLQSDINTKRLRTLETRNGGGLVLTSDTLVNDIKGNMRLPSGLGFGISVGKPLKWLAGIDVRLQPWDTFQNYEGADGGLQNAMSVVLGGEYTPDAGSIDKILRRVTYRLGMSYEKTPYVVNNNGVDDLGINFGWSIPVSGISSLDMGFRFGKRGSIGSNQLKEDYFRMQLGVTFNDRLWFIKRKFD